MHNYDTILWVPSWLIVGPLTCLTEWLNVWLNTIFRNRSKKSERFASQRSKHASNWIKKKNKKKKIPLVYAYIHAYVYLLKLFIKYYNKQRHTHICVCVCVCIYVCIYKLCISIAIDFYEKEKTATNKLPQEQINNNKK